MSERISPETKMLWSAYDKGKCGTVYLKGKMADMEAERDEMERIAQELRDVLQAFVDADNECEREFKRMGMPPPDPCPIRERMVSSLTKAKEVLS